MLNVCLGPTTHFLALPSLTGGLALLAAWSLDLIHRANHSTSPWHNLLLDGQPCSESSIGSAV